MKIKRHKFRSSVLSTIKRQIPNILSIFRIFLAFWCFYMAMTFSPYYLSISLGLFVIAAATDYLDGYLARKWNTISSFGKIVDPIADKILILGVLFIFSYKGVVPMVLAIIIAFREILLTVIRLLLLSKKIVIASIQSGKFKTASQVCSVVIIYIMLIFKIPIREVIGVSSFNAIILGLIIWVTSITLYSGFEFFVQNTKAIKQLSW